MKYIVIVLIANACLFYQQQEKKDSWQIAVNKKQVATGFLTESINMSLEAEAKDKIIITYVAAEKKDDKIRSIVIMNNGQQELWRKNFSAKHKVEIDANTLKQLTLNSDFGIYTVAVSNNAQVAATMRVATILLCNVHWQQK